MENLTKVTGLSENKIKALYLSSIETLVKFGASEEQARKITQESMTTAINNQLK